MCKQKKIKEDEMHLIILWNEKNIQECERYIINKFQVIKKIFIPSLLHKFGDNKRKHLIGAI